VDKLVLAFSYPADNINCVLSIRTNNKFYATGEFHNPKYDSTTFPKSTTSHQVYFKCYYIICRGRWPWTDLVIWPRTVVGTVDTAPGGGFRRMGDRVWSKIQQLHTISTQVSTFQVVH